MLKLQQLDELNDEIFAAAKLRDQEELSVIYNQPSFPPCIHNILGSASRAVKEIPKDYILLNSSNHITLSRISDAVLKQIRNPLNPDFETINIVELRDAVASLGDFVIDIKENI